jgi:colanic acid biosynthesis glycosyl transferase WcaI
MAHILLLTLVFAPDGVSTAVLMTELAAELKQLGHELTVLTTTPHYNVEPEARARQPLRKRWGGLLYESEIEGIRVLHASIPVKGSRVGARILDYLRFHAISTLAGLIAVRSFDLIIAPSPPLTIGLSAWVLRLFRQAPYVYNVQEIYPDVAVSLGMLKNPHVIRLFESLERFVYARARVITVISEWFRRRLLEKGVNPAKLKVIPNFVDTAFIEPGSKRNDFSLRYGLDDKFVVQYAGNIGLTQGFEAIFEAARLVQDIPDIIFLIVGDGTRREWLEQQLARAPASNIMLLPYQPRSEVPMIYAAADVCLVPLKRGTAQETFPSKIYTIMAAARAVIASADENSELAWVVQEAKCGWSVPPDDAAKMAGAIREAFAQRSILPVLGENGRAYVEVNHSKRAVAQQYDALIRSLTRG